MRHCFGRHTQRADPVTTPSWPRVLLPNPYRTHLRRRRPPSFSLTAAAAAAAASSSSSSPLCRARTSVCRMPQATSTAAASLVPSLPLPRLQSCGGDQASGGGVSRILRARFKSNTKHKHSCHPISLKRESTTADKLDETTKKMEERHTSASWRVLTRAAPSPLLPP